VIPRPAVVVALALLAGCGGSAPKQPADNAAPPRPARPDDARCADLTTKAAAHKLARKLVDRVVAPDGQSERETIGIIGESLHATCTQPRLPGVADVQKYRPVKPVLAEIQRDFDEDAITGG
jgi:hypothetical protein